MFIEVDNIEELHVEITNNCNARCPMCARNIFGGNIAPGLELTEWSENDVDLVFSKNLKKLKKVYFCGSHGDPLAAKHLFEIIKKVKKLNLQIEIFTNGSLKTKEWWEIFLDLLDEKDLMVFGVDGLETNHLYRQNTDIKKILTHMSLACQSKAKVRWEFLAFKHNEHEIDICRKKANEIGVDEFVIKRTPRFDLTTKFPVLDNNFEITHYLEPPINPDHIHPGLKQMSAFYKNQLNDNDIVKRAQERAEFKSMQYYTYNNSLDYKIDCLYKKKQKLYVNSRLDVFPCSFISDQYEGYKFLSDNELKYPSGELNLKEKSWMEILNHPYYTDDLIKSWKDTNTPVRCIRICGLANRVMDQKEK